MLSLETNVLSQALEVWKLLIMLSGSLNLEICLHHESLTSYSSKNLFQQ